MHAQQEKTERVSLWDLHCQSPLTARSGLWTIEYLFTSTNARLEDANRIPDHDRETQTDKEPRVKLQSASNRVVAAQGQDNQKWSDGIEEL